MMLDLASRIWETRAFACVRMQKINMNAYTQRARDVASEGLKALEQGKLQEARDHFYSAEVAFRDIGDTVCMH
jgi:hypothetical protein